MESNICVQRDPAISRSKRIKKGKMAAPHYHEEHELYYLAEGSATYFIGDEIYSIQAGEFVFIPRGIPHMTEYERNGYNERVLLSFPNTVFSENTVSLVEKLAQIRVVRVPEKDKMMLEELLDKIETENGRKERDNILIGLYIQELMALLCRHQCERKVNIQVSDRIVYDVSEYINTHYEQEITLESLSRQFAFSEEYLSRKFKAVSGIGINQYLTYVRISNGERLLRESKLSMTQVAQRCGYNNSNYFSTVFKKMKGVTPLMYRKKQQMY